VGRGDLKDSEGWKQVPVWGNKRTVPQPVPPSQVPLHNRCEALELEGLGDVDAGESPSMQERLPNASQSAPRFATTSDRKKRRAVIIGDSLLRGTEGPICCLDPSHREVCCLPVRSQAQVGLGFEHIGVNKLALKTREGEQHLNIS